MKRSNDPTQHNRHASNAWQSPTATASQRNIMNQEIEILSKQINELLDKSRNNDPEFKKNAKILTRVIKTLNNRTKKSLNEEEQMPIPQDLINMNLDDSIVHALDDVVSAYQTVKNIFDK